MRIFGLTGGIASGKSTVAARWRAHGLPIIDADELAREVVAPGTPGLRQITEAFGPTVLLADGVLDRAALARIVFSDPAARSRLNAITHPRIMLRTQELGVELAAAGHALGCFEAALLVENGTADLFRPLVVVACPEDVQLARLLSRGTSREEALGRIRAQKPLSEKTAAADYVIDTSGSTAASGERADEVLQAIRSSMGPTR